ncbi:MAG: hypothetical protein PHV10_06125 [Sulfuricurvum sp.]|nr:hypothetical protein [Sulfuricurvum sp.]
METLEATTLLSATPEQYTELREIWNEYLAKNEMPEYIYTAEDIDAMIMFAYYLQTRENAIIAPLKKLGIIQQTTKEVFTVFEKSIMSIAKSDYITKLMHNRNKEKRKLRGNSLKAYLAHVVPEGRMNGGYVVAKAIYDSYTATLKMRVNRVKNSPKVQDLAQKYPDVDVHNIVAVSVIQGKIQLVQDDLDWIEQIIKIACNIETE